MWKPPTHPLFGVALVLFGGYFALATGVLAYLSNAADQWPQVEGKLIEVQLDGHCKMAHDASMHVLYKYEVNSKAYEGSTYSFWSRGCERREIVETAATELKRFESIRIRYNPWFPSQSTILSASESKDLSWLGVLAVNLMLVFFGCKNLLAWRRSTSDPVRRLN